MNRQHGASRSKKEGQSAMSTMNPEIAGVFSRRLLQWSEGASHLPVTAISTASAGRNLLAVAVFSAIGLLASLLFAHFFADGLSAILARAT